MPCLPAFGLGGYFFGPLKPVIFLCARVVGVALNSVSRYPETIYICLALSYKKDTRCNSASVLLRRPYGYYQIS